MFVLLPVWSRSAQAPLYTTCLVGLNILVFLITWPLEKSRQGVVSEDQYTEQARQLSRILLDPKSQLNERDRVLLQTDQAREDFPTPAVLDLFQRVDGDAFIVSSETRYRWKMVVPLFQSLKRSVGQKPDATTPFHSLGFKPHQRIFPGLITHMVLHAGWLHLIFNMLFLWIAGLVLEPVLRGSITGLYLFGGIAAALAQWGWGVPPAEAMVGASGAIAALMGFALFAMPSARVTLFYAYLLAFMPRGGTFESPLWFCIPLWALQQMVLLWMPLKGELANVGYAAHVGGFAFGALAGLGYGLTHKHHPQPGF